MRPPAHKPNFTIRKYTENDRPGLLRLWERSVAATHHFLSPQDFAAIKAELQAIDFAALSVYCLASGEELAGFVLIAGKKLEALFIDPKYFGLGGGKQLVDFALAQHGVDSVDVNEQNPGALAFYKKLGFNVTERTERDDQGRPYPLLRMKRKPL